MLVYHSNDVSKWHLYIYSFAASLTVSVHLEEVEEGEVEVEVLAEMVTKGVVEVLHVVRMDLHANERSELFSCQRNRISYT